MNTIVEAAQTRFFARAVAGPVAVGVMWPAPINPANSVVEEWVEGAGRDWRDHGAYWIQNNNDGKSDGYTSAASRIAGATIQNSEVMVSMGGKVEECEVEDLGCEDSGMAAEGRLAE